MDLLLTILGWVLFGLVIGGIGRLLIPGRDPMGIVATIVLGIVGSLVGGGIGWVLSGGTDPYAPAGWILSILGAVLALLCYYWAGGRRETPA